MAAGLYTRQWESGTITDVGDRVVRGLDEEAPRRAQARATSVGINELLATIPSSTWRSETSSSLSVGRKDERQIVSGETRVTVPGVGLPTRVTSRHLLSRKLSRCGEGSPTRRIGVECVGAGSKRAVSRRHARSKPRLIKPGNCCEDTKSSRLSTFEGQLRHRHPLHGRCRCASLARYKCSQDEVELS